MDKKVIFTKQAPKAIGPYSQAIKISNMLFSSGQVPIDPKTSKVEAKNIKDQSRQVMENIKSILEEESLGFDNIVKTTCFLSDLNNFSDFNEVYASYFSKEPPARSCVQVARLPLDVLVEVEFIAVYSANK